MAKKKKVLSLKESVLEKFTSAEILNESDERVEFLLKSANENLNSTLQDIFNLNHCYFQLVQRLEDYQIRIVMVKKNEM
jgi:hypothetical protein